MENRDGKGGGPGARMSDSALDLAHRGGGGGGAASGSPRSVLEGGASFYDLGQADEVDVDLLADRFHRVATETDPKDVPTPDRWIARHPQLIRLTGRHPLNCEAPLSVLMQQGYWTPVGLHYVRNHGAVPRLDWDTHTIEVSGMVQRPETFSLDRLIEVLTPQTLPITLVCAGNRRKEQNLVRKTVGFNWGPAAVSTSYWTGIKLCDLLRYCGVLGPRQGARFVCFEGIGGELPQGADGAYGTSMHYMTAMDPSCEVMLAYKQNGRTLQPDHGYPIRMIIPGYIGGRMVKWISKIVVTSEESQNFYHFHDNRILPPGVDQERAKKEGWWFRPEYLFNELNVNSVITSPAHDEVLQLDQEMYTLHGYAYSGGGRPVIRCEVSLDGGMSWMLANIHREEEPTIYNKYWCWVLWAVEVPMVDLVKSDELRCRAVDCSNNMQPKELTWNLMGMGNNPHYVVKMHSAPIGSSVGMRFEHPCQAGGLGGGWMEREYKKKEEEALAEGTGASKTVDEALLPAYTLAEVEKHDSYKSAWFTHDGKVYDASRFLKGHPGGPESILIVAGQDATDEFNAIHSARAKAMLAEYLIGKIVNTGDSELARDDKVVSTSGQELIALNPRKKIAFPLTEKISLSPNTRLFRFGLQSPQHKLGLPIGQHMFFYAKDRGELVMRAYTPTSSDDDLGHFDLVVKIYYANQHKDFPEGGRMSLVLDSMKIGDTMDVKGPLGHFVYEGHGRFRDSGKPGTCTHMSMVAGGTGITPMYQIIKAVLKNPKDSTQIRLLFANQSQEDILLRAELDDFAKDARFQVHYLLSRPVGDWTGGSKGRISEDLCREFFVPGGSDALALMCGPPGMQDCAMDYLEKIGYPKDEVIVF